MSTYFNEKKLVLIGLIILIVIINAIVFKKIYYNDNLSVSSDEYETEEYEAENTVMNQQTEKEGNAAINETVDGEYEEASVEESVPRVNIFDIQSLYKNGGDMIFSHRGDTGRTDNLGNVFSADAYEIYASGDDRSITFPLDEKYSTLSGSLAIRKNESHESLWLEFYSGDILVGKTEVLKDGVRPINFSVDVSGVVDLTIVAKTETGYGFAYTDGFYLE